MKFKNLVLIPALLLVALALTARPSNAGLLVATGVFSDENDPCYNNIVKAIEIGGGTILFIGGLAVMIEGFTNEFNWKLGLGVGVPLMALEERETSENALQFEEWLKKRYPEINDLETYRTLSREIARQFESTPVTTNEAREAQYRYVIVPEERVLLALGALSLDPSQTARMIADLSK